MVLDLAILAAALGVLVLGAELLVRGASALASRCGMSPLLIGLTLVAFGASMPALGVSVGGAPRGSGDIAIGNAIGSNVFNGFCILGASATVRPLAFDPRGNVDVAAAALGSLLLFAAMFSGDRNRLDRWEGAVFLLTYAGHVGVRYTLEGG